MIFVSSNTKTQSDFLRAMKSWQKDKTLARRQLEKVASTTETIFMLLLKPTFKLVFTALSKEDKYQIHF